MKRVITVTESHYGECELDVEKVIALVPKRSMLLFESTYWKLSDEDFRKVAEIWRELKS